MKWEYRVESYTVKHDFRDTRVTNLQELQDLCSRLGGDGWELTGIIATNAGHLTTLVFKREMGIRQDGK